MNKENKAKQSSRVPNISLCHSRCRCRFTSSRRRAKSLSSEISRPTRPFDIRRKRVNKKIIPSKFSNAWRISCTFDIEAMPVAREIHPRDANGGSTSSGARVDIKGKGERSLLPRLSKKVKLITG